MNSEPVIIVSGITLDHRQTTIVRIAMNEFQRKLMEDEVMKRLDPLGENYLRLAKEIQALLHGFTKGANE